MSTNEADAPARSAPARVRRGLRGLTDRWPFQRKLNVLVGVPLAVIAVLLTYVITDLLQESSRAEDAAQLVRDSSEVAQLVSLVEAEHQQAILLSVRHEASFDGGTPSTDPYRVAQVKVDEQVRKVRDSFGGRLPAGEAQALREVEGLAGLRTTIEQGYLPADNIDPAYTGAARGLIDGLGLDRNSALATTFTGNLLDSLLRADAAHGAFETGVFSALTGDSNALIEFTGAVGAYELYTYQAQRFSRFASADQADRLGGVEHNAAQAVIDQHYAELSVDPSALQSTTTEQIRTSLRQALAAYGDYQQQAENRLKITDSLIGEIADRADDAASSARWRVTLLLNLAIVGFVLWIAFSVLVRRSVVRPVLALTGAAREVADVAGRELARVADDDAEETGSPRLRELPVTADDEIGELAEAFNNVQTTAAALLERQVLSRRNVAEMFGNVGRRVSNLTTRQLTLIDAVERGETDPALLERLYSIDHIAVRLRRNADSLMLLAGIRETVLDSGPTALTNVVRAALGQIEGYQRVELRAASEVMVEPDIIGDLTLMVAELLENAVSFSPADSPVEVGVRSHAEGASITVVDHGLGMSAERLAEENARLVRRERLDLVPTKVLGLFVVGALARRWEIEVTLSRTPGGGLTAEVSLPSALLLTLSGQEPGLAETVVRKSAVSAGSFGADARTSATVSTERSVGEDGGASGERPSTARHFTDAGTPRTADAADTGTPRTADADMPRTPDATDSPAPAGSSRPDPADNPAPGGSSRPEPADTLPRRPPADDPAPFIPRARSEERPEAGPRPLKRRVRGATLRTTVDAAAQQAARTASRPADADAVRDALDEFEEAVARANADTAEHPAGPFTEAAPFTGAGPGGENVQDTTQNTLAHDDVHSRRPPTDDRNPTHHQNHLPEGAEQ
ncbi:HAMP domain-containing protein [Streptomyces roseirectus]|uniref:histidine kinase n=1 Tax=Streptomyces roseirectus TaxID=2768066 RepID=A0A7H0I9R9_9ACTN|nr:ATP-binding protein [Streptomyces roseirectus]QNP69535.1 HAMP domain-containing protein [Streptomyces roseirectus]